MGPLRQRIESIPIASGAVPKPAGPHRPAVAALSIAGPDGPLAVDVWYPRDVEAAGRAAPQSVPVTTRFPRAVPLGLVEGAPMVASPQRLPLIIFAPGWNGTRSSNTVLLASLASAGYIIVAIDDVGADPEAPLAVRDFDFSSETGFERSWSAGRERIDLMSRRITAVIDGMLALSSAPGVIAGRVDPDAIAVAGFSFGGSVAAEAPAADPRIKAAINLDGWLFGASRQRGVGVPYLSFSSEFPDLEAASRSRSVGKRVMATATIEDRRIQRVLAGDPRVYALILLGTQHLDFTDGLFLPPLRSYLRAPWGLSKSRQLRVFDLTVNLMIAFLDTYLRQAPLAPLLSERAGTPDIVWFDPE